ncbi:recombinase family protein [Microbacterium lacus]|uniref:Resolvase/invertase-type recombinase catalytic domain-containing protein n=1 Tax=Microbacterium lacus TaxID=415217 RepID=A0ABN2FY38_9MICO
MSRIVGYTREIDGAGAAGDVAELERAGAVQVFTDVASDKPRDRPGLAQCLASLARRDELLVVSSDRLSPNLAHLVSTVADLTDRGVVFRSLSEPALCTTAEIPAGPGEVLLALQHLQRRLRGVETRAGMVSASAQGRHPGRPSVMTEERIAIARELRNHDRSFSHIARVLGVSTSAVQRALRAS